MISWGINALNHGSSIAVISDKLEFFQIDKTNDISDLTVDLALLHGKPDRIYWYENPWIKKCRQLYAGQYKTAFDMSVLPTNHLKKVGLNHIPLTYTKHHYSHAAAGYYTSPFTDAAVVVLDAIGEFECATIWHGKDNQLKKVWSASYPNSLGLFYSAFTQLIGFIPIQQEHLLQLSATAGDPNRYYNVVKQYFNGTIQVTRNLHRGVLNWPFPIKNLQDQADIAAAVQRVFEEQLHSVLELAFQLTKSYNLVYMGGCAMNSDANKKQLHNWEKVWSLPNPGDPSSAIGAVLWHTKQRIIWQNNTAKHIDIKG